MGTVCETMPRLAASARRVGDTVIAGVARRHEHTDDVLGAERVDGNRRDQGRVDAARQTHEHLRETVLTHVVTRPEHERFVDLAHRCERRLDTRGDPFVEWMRVAHRDHRKCGRVDAPSRIALTLVERGSHVDIEDQQVGNELLGASDQHALLVEHERCAVEDELVLAADEVRVDDGDRSVGRPGRQHGFAFGEALRVIRRRVEVDDQLCATGGLDENRAGRAPGVFTDRDADLHSGHIEQRQRLVGHDEVTLFVEHCVVRQYLFAVHAHDAPVCAHCRCVVQVAAGLRESDHRRRTAGASRELFQRLRGLGNERRAQQQVFGRVPGHRELREDDEIAPGGLGFVVRLEHPGGIPLEVADDDVQLGGGDPQTRHDPRIRGRSPPRERATHARRVRDTRPVTRWQGDEYQRRFDELASKGVDVHGEADFVMRYRPASVLDAGCGTGRVAIELARRGVDVVGVDVDASMLATAPRTARA